MHVHLLGMLNPMCSLEGAGAAECFLPERCGEPLTGLLAIPKHVSV